MAIILITVISGKKEERLWYRAMRHYLLNYTYYWRIAAERCGWDGPAPLGARQWRLADF
jgi:hypothetical protein